MQWVLRTLDLGFWVSLNGLHPFSCLLFDRKVKRPYILSWMMDPHETLNNPEFSQSSHFDFNWLSTWICTFHTYYCTKQNTPIPCLSKQYCTKLLRWVQKIVNYFYNLLLNITCKTPNILQGYPFIVKYL